MITEDIFKIVRLAHLVEDERNARESAERKLAALQEAVEAALSLCGGNSFVGLRVALAKSKE